MPLAPKASVIALAGRRIDPPRADIHRFPLAAVDRVTSAVWRLIGGSGARSYVSSAACGADLIGLQVAGQLGLRREIVLPFAPARFRQTSVGDRPGEWLAVFDALIAHLDPGAMTVLGTMEGSPAYERANAAILDRAIEIAGRPDDVLAIVVWDGAARPNRDITALFREAAAARGVAIAQVLTLETD